MSAFAVRRLETLTSREFGGLCDVLVDCVEGGASVSFMHPMTIAKAADFWREVAASMARGERALLIAEDERGAIIGTAQVVWATPENQPHRAEIVKMITRISHRGRGVATALLRRAEKIALARGRTLLVLDTASDGGAAPLYESVGFKLAGEIPDYAFKPQGGLTGTKFYWKRLAAPVA
jgi:ribosomal protein S18 acetylase RimI-like enzyme